MLQLLRTDPYLLEPADLNDDTLRAVWIDLLAPSASESKAVEAATGLHIASRDQLTEIESSSRLSERDGAVYFSIPIVEEGPDGAPRGSQLGIALSESHIVTIRFGEIPGLQSIAARLASEAPPRPATVFVTLLEALIDRTADQLEQIRDRMDATATQIFTRHAGADGPSRDNRELRQALQQVSRTGDLLSRLRDTLLVAGRVAGYVAATGSGWFPKDLRPRIKTLRLDIASLMDFDSHLSEKVHFLLDAILGFVNIAQNHIIKVVAVVGTVGVPPTLIASIYGMNFEAMPELRWAWGYPVALVLIVASAIAPLWLFRRKGWL